MKTLQENFKRADELLIRLKMFTRWFAGDSVDAVNIRRIDCAVREREQLLESKRKK